MEYMDHPIIRGFLIIGGYFHVNRAIPKMTIGTIKSYNPRNGYGFIHPDDGSRDVLVDINAVQHAGLAALNRGQRIRYKVIKKRGKQFAADLKTL